MQWFLILLTMVVISCAQLTSVGDNSIPKETFSEGDINLDVHKMVLDNGLKVLLVKNSKLPIFSFYTFYGVGSKHESKGITGSSHFLEHMMFKGAQGFGYDKFDSIIEGNGGSSNAYTTNDETVYYEKLPSKSLDLIIKVEADRIQKILLEPKAFDKERNVVLEERKMRYENRPGGKLYLKMMEAMFEKTPYGRSVIGDIPDLKSVTHQQVHEYFKTHYAPNNAVVVIVGDMNIALVKDQIKSAFANIPASLKLKEQKEKFEKESLYKFSGRYNREIKINATNPIPKFMYAFQGVKMGKREAFVLDILSSVLGDGKSSHFNQLFVDSKKPALSGVGVGNYNLTHSGVFYVSGSLLKRTNLRRFKKTLKKELRRVCNPKVVNARAVQKVKNNYLVGMYSGLQTNSGVASFIGNFEHSYDDYSYYKKELEIYDSITPSDVIKECKNIFDNKKSIFVSVWNKHPAAKASRKNKKRKK
jgi:zinc protease